MEKRSLRPFGMRDKLGYLFGDFGNDFTFILSTSILMKFYTDVMGVGAGAVGLVMMLARFVDAFTDVAMGRICDRSRPTSAGKFKPWLLRMCVPVAAASFLMYAPGLSEGFRAAIPAGGRVVYLAVTYILWGSFCYTGINIPYGSMASAVSTQPGDRQSLSTYRTIGGMLAGMVIGVVLPLIAYDTVALSDGTAQDVLSGTKVAIIAAVFSLLAIGSYLLSYWLTTERVAYRPDPKAQENVPVGKMLRNALYNRPLISIIVASIVMLLAQLTMQNMGAYIFPDYYNNAPVQTASSLTMMGAMLVAASVAKPLAVRFGKAEVSVVSNVLAAAVCLVTFLIRPANVWVYVALQTLCWLGLGVFSMVNWALITDVIDDSELRTGVREDGAIYALYSFARKLGQAAASGLTGFLLELIGYNENALTEGVRQTQEVLNGIFSISTLVPALGLFLLALVLWFWYPLHKKQVEANVAALAKKHEEKRE